MGERFGNSLIDANRILDDLNPRMPQIRAATEGVADLADVYAAASPDLWDGLENAVTTARTFNDQRENIDTALMAAIGFSNTAADSFERGGPYLVRGSEDLLPTTKLLDDYRDMIFCTARNYAGGPRIAKVLGGATATRCTRRAPSSRRAAFVYRQPAAGERQGRTRGSARLLEEGHQVPVSVPVSGDGHRCQHRPVQPLGDRVADRHRLRLGPAVRRAHNQPVTVGPHTPARRWTTDAATAPASLMARCASIGAARLPEHSRSSAKSQPATPVTNTVPITGSSVPRASAMCDRPNANDCTNRPTVDPNASAATVPKRRAERSLLRPHRADRDAHQQPRRLRARQIAVGHRYPHGRRRRRRRHPQSHRRGHRQPESQTRPQCGWPQAERRAGRCDESGTEERVDEGAQAQWYPRTDKPVPADQRRCQCERPDSLGVH